MMGLILTMLLGGLVPSFSDLVTQRAVESQLVRTHADLRRALEEQANRIDEVKRQGGVQELRLEKMMAAAQETAHRLAKAEQQLQAQRRKVIDLCDRALPAIREETVRTKVVQIRAEEAAALASPRTERALSGALGISESASDGPEELREKADLLKDAQEKILRELALLERRFVTAKRRGELVRSMRSLENDLFGEDVRKQSAGQASSSFRSSAGDRAAAPSAAPAANQARDQPAGASAPETSNPGALQNPSVPSSAPPAVTTPVGGALAPGDVLVLKDLLDPATLANLARPQDSTTYLRGLERARQQLQSIAAELNRRSELLRQRADELLPQTR